MKPAFTTETFRAPVNDPRFAALPEDLRDHVCARLSAMRVIAAAPSVTAGVKSVVAQRTGRGWRPGLGFMRDSGLAKEPAPNEGWHHSQEELEGFLKLHHPDLCGKAYGELPAGSAATS